MAQKKICKAVGDSGRLKVQLVHVEQGHEIPYPPSTPPGQLASRECASCGDLLVVVT